MVGTVRAAGGVVLRHRPDGVSQVALVHRPRYDDWSLPKGKLDPNETFEDAALREVLEETGLRCRLGSELPAVNYRDGKGRSKEVRYWLMSAEGEPTARFVPGPEVDQLRWCELGLALALLSYERDRVLLREALRRSEDTEAG